MSSPPPALDEPSPPAIVHHQPPSPVPSSPMSPGGGGATEITTVHVGASSSFAAASSGSDMDESIAKRRSTRCVIIWWSQFQALLRKNYQVLRRQWKSTSYFLLGPIIVLLIILIISKATNSGDNSTSTKYTTTSLSLDKCQSLDIYGNVYERPDKCVSVIYAPNKEPYASIMNEVRDSLGWTDYDVQGFKDTDRMAGWAFDHVGLADMFINFNRVTSPVVPASAHRVSYELWYNETGSMMRATALQAKIDLAILKVLKNDSSATASASMNINLQVIEPVITASTDDPTMDSVDNDDWDPVVAVGLNIVIVVSLTVASLLIVQTISNEKKNKLVGRMRIMGLNESAYWSTWFLSYLPIALIVSLIVPAIGIATGFPVYTRTTYGVHVVLMFMFWFSIIALALCVSSCVSQPRWVNVASIIFFFVAIFTSIFPFAVKQNQWYKPDTSNFLTFIFWCMPWFHFNKSLGDIIRQTRSELIHPDTVNQTRTYPHFTWDNMTSKQWWSDDCDVSSCCSTSSEYGFDQKTCYMDAPSVSYSMWMQLCVAICYLALAWYIGQLGGDLGASQKWYFPLTSTYWGCAKKKTRDGLVEGDTLSKEQIASREQRSVRTYKLSKAFKDQSAVKEVSLQMERGECFVLLGHNGAGKTTMINMLTGLFPPTYGEGYIFGMDIREDTSQIQQVMGICPQEDWLWPQLTSFEHLLLFAALRGLPRQIWPKAITAKLAEFHLNDLINTPTAKLSGGMKRRLSLAMATLGAPDIIFLDEPTTGMDPVNKHKVWNAIAALKRDKIIVLTTHSMEEADFLGDKVAMMSGGRLRAMGTSLYLKNHFGAGYQIHLLSSPSNIPQLEQVVKDILPSAEIVGNAGGNLTIALPRKSVRLIPDFFRWIDQSKKSAEGGILVKEWSISNSTLEEVFLRLCSTEKAVNEMTVDFVKKGRDDEDSKRMCVICNKREAQLVTVLTQSGIRVQCPNLICMQCCMGDGFVDEEKRLKEIDEQKAKEIEDGGMFGGTNNNGDDIRTISMVNNNNNGEAKSAAVAAAPLTIMPPANNDGVTTSMVNIQSPTAAAAVSVVVEDGGIRGLKDAVGVRPASMYQQVRAVFLKNFALALTEKKTWLFKLAILVGIAFWMGIDQKGGSDNKTDCSWVASYSQPCDRYSWISAMFGTSYTYMGSTRSFSSMIYDSSLPAPADQPWLTGGYREVPNWASTSYGYDYGGIGYYVNNIRFQDSTRVGDTPLREYDLTTFGKGRMNRTAYMTLVESSDTAAELATNRGYVIGNATAPPFPECASTGKKWYLPFAGDDAVFKYVKANLFGDTYLTMSRSNPSLLQFDYTLGFWPSASWGQTGYYPWSVSTNGTNPYSSSYHYCFDNAKANTDPNSSPPGMINAMTNAMARTALWNDTSIGTSFVQYYAAKFVPVMTKESIAQSSAMLAFITMLLWPTYVYRIIYEREERLFHMMRISGMKTNNYWIANYLFDAMMQIIWSIFFLIIPAAFGATAIVPGFGAHAIILICYTHSLLGMSIFISALFTSRLQASVVGYFIVIITAGLAAVLPLVMSSNWPIIMYIIPPLAYIRALDLAVRYGSSAFTAQSGDMTASLIMMILMGTVWLFIGLYLNTIKYRSSLYIIDSCRPSAAAKRRTSQVHDSPRRGGARDGGAHDQQSDGIEMKKMNNCDNNNNGNGDDNNTIGGGMDGMGASPELLAKEDIDVGAERKRVMNSSWSGQDAPAIIIKNLVKSFTKSGTEKNDKLAVNHICLGIDRGECFGLLGPNGAGKTTTLSILSGLLDQTSGSVRVGEFDTRTEIDLVYTILGICPQFDTVWEDLSIRDHFLFYARLKGATKEYEAALAQRQAEMVDLDGDAFNKPALSLSGGMKRRLSIGISLIGNPKVWLLDEPSTGLSPEARRQVWDIVSKQRKVGRTVIITTHSMEEADTLCSRIGIVAKGQLKCLGTQSHLKGRFGDGFKLVFNLDHITTRRIDNITLAGMIEVDRKDISRDNELDEYVINDLTCRGAVLSGAVGKNMVYTLPKDGATTEDVLRIFNAMERRQKEMKLRFGVVEWGVQQSSLEEVFISVVDQAERDDTTSDASAAMTASAAMGVSPQSFGGATKDKKNDVNLAEITRMTSCC